MSFRLPRLDLPLPRFASGGLVGPAIAAVSSGGASAAPLHPVTLVMPGGKRVGGMFATPSAATQLTRAASRKSAVSAGPAPGWDGI